MSRLPSEILRVCSAAALCLMLIRPDAARAQTVHMGMSLVNGGNVNPPGAAVQTVLAMFAAEVDGRITTATFGWSESPCAAAVKIKVFRPSVPLFTVGFPDVRPPFAFVTERGPFDVTAPVERGFASQTVEVSPSVDVQAGDLVAITNVTTCGGPVHSRWPYGFPPFRGGSFTVPGDVTSTVTDGTVGDFIFLAASGPSPALALFSSRFAVTLTAVDPRTGVAADGVPNLLGFEGTAGYFSLPAFTGNPRFPEVTVKMLDATGSPTLGGGFWFFHSPLTDVQYTITVKDQYTGAVKTYSNTPGNPSQLCGGVDTSAFPP